MTNARNTLPPNSLAFLGLSSEYCKALESAHGCEQNDFVTTMLRLLPRIYISATDLATPQFGDDSYIDNSLSEEQYEGIRGNIAALLGEYDTYLEVFEEDMKFSDTPIAASISEGLCDIYQVLFNTLEAAKDAPAETMQALLALTAEDFNEYWSQTLCNVLRAINQLKNHIGI